MKTLSELKAEIFGAQMRSVMSYQQAFMREFDDWVVRNLNSPLDRLQDAELMELCDDICETLRVKFNLNPEVHAKYKKMIKDIILRKRGNDQ